MCGAPGKGKFRLPGARITSVFKIRKSATPSSPNDAGKCLFLSVRQFPSKMISIGITKVQLKKRLKQSIIGSPQLGCCFVSGVGYECTCACFCAGAAICTCVETSGGHLLPSITSHFIFCNTVFLNLEIANLATLTDQGVSQDCIYRRVLPWTIFMCTWRICTLVVMLMLKKNLTH